MMGAPVEEVLSKFRHARGRKGHRTFGRNSQSGSRNNFRIKRGASDAVTLQGCAVRIRGDSIIENLKEINRGR